MCSSGRNALASRTTLRRGRCVPDGRVPAVFLCGLMVVVGERDRFAAVPLDRLAQPDVARTTRPCRDPIQAKGPWS